MVWDEQGLKGQRSAQLLPLSRPGEGVLIFEGTGCDKKGRSSAGVARQ